MSATDFWSNRERAQADVEEVSRLRSLINPLRELEREVEDFGALQQLAAEETDAAVRTHAEHEVAAEHDRLVHKLDEFELRQFLSGENDRASAFVTIHSGAGGTESCDWADMLLRMYQRWIERNGFKSQIVDLQVGEEVGIKSATLLVSGEYAYGHLQADRHRRRLPGRAQSGAQPRARAQNVESETLRNRAGQKARRDRSAIWRERRHRLGQPNSLVRFPAVSNGEGPPHRRRDQQCSS